MQSTQPSSDAWSDDAIKTLLEYAGWYLAWSSEDEGWLVGPKSGTMLSTIQPTLQDVHEFYINYMKWYYDDGPEISKS